MTETCESTWDDPFYPVKLTSRKFGFSNFILVRVSLCDISAFPWVRYPVWNWPNPLCLPRPLETSSWNVWASFWWPRLLEAVSSWPGRRLPLRPLYLLSHHYCNTLNISFFLVTSKADYDLCCWHVCLEAEGSPLTIVTRRTSWKIRKYVIAVLDMVGGVTGKNSVLPEG